MISPKVGRSLLSGLSSYIRGDYFNTSLAFFDLIENKDEVAKMFFKKSNDGLEARSFKSISDKFKKARKKLKEIGSIYAPKEVESVEITKTQTVESVPSSPQIDKKKILLYSIYGIGSIFVYRLLTRKNK